MRRTLTLLSLFLLACTWPSEAQVPVDTTGWRYTDSVPTGWRYTDSVPVLDALPPPVDTTTPPPSGGTLSANDFRNWGDAGSGFPWLWRGGQVVIDPARGSVLQFAYPAGKVGGTAPGNVWIDEAVLRAKAPAAFTLTGWLYVSPNWQGHLTNTNKALFLGFGPNGNQLILNLHGKGAGPLRAMLQFQGMAVLPLPKSSCGAAGCSGLSASLPFSRGQWHLIQISATATSVSLDLDGQRAATVTGLQWAKSGTPYLAKVALNPTWGGGGDKVTSAMQMRWDAVQVVAP